MRKSIYSDIFILSVALLAILSLADLRAQTYRIMPLGNSITRGSMCLNGSIYSCERISDADAIGYRDVLFNLLDAAGYDFDFVGSEDFGGNEMTDTDNAGFSGIRSSELADVMETGTSTRTGLVTEGPYLELYPADIILLHIGTNDVQDSEITVSGVERILDAIDSYEVSSGNPVMVFLARIITRNGNLCNEDAEIVEFNSNLDAMADTRIASGDSLRVVDMECGAGLDFSTDMSDELHPNQTGYDKMGQAWYDAVDAYLSAIPKTPSGLMLDGETNSSIDLSWNDNSSNETGFEIERSLTSSGGDFELIHTTLAEDTSFTSNGLTGDTQYYYRVRAINDSGASLYTSVESTYTLPDPPLAPTGLSATAGDENTIDLAWSDTNNENSYTIERSTSSATGYTAIDTLSPNITSYRDETLTEGTEYFYRIYASNQGGDSDYSDVASAVTDLAAPTNLTAAALDENSIQLSWVDISTHEDGYKIERSQSSGSGFTEIDSTPEDAESYTDEGLNEATQYFYRIYASGAGSVSDYSNEASATTDLAVPDPPSDLNFTEITTSAIRLNWVDNADNESGYEVWRSESLAGTYDRIAELGVDAASYNDTGLDEDTEYFYRVNSVNAAGSSDYISGSATTLLAVPDAPSNLKGSATNTCTVDLTWKDNADNENGFVIRRATSLAGPYDSIQSVASETTTYTDTDTQNENTYYYRVYAFNDAGSSSYASVSVTIAVVLDGGTIGPDQDICPGDDPELIQSYTPPSGGSNNWTYQWQSRATGDFSDITGATGLSYDPPEGMIETTEFQRVSTVECGSVSSNIVTITAEDNEDPVFTSCPEDIILVVERNEVSGEVDTPDPVVTDNCGIILQTWSMSGATVASSPETGINYVGLYTFNLGVTTVTYHVEDNAGNTAECSFNVTVETKKPEVLDVEIPDKTMKIGDVVTATITVGDDGGTEYSLLSGTIGGYSLDKFQRDNSTIYYANFVIEEGGNSYPASEDIPVTNLVVFDDSDNSAPYNGFIAQDNDLLDAERPVINSMIVESGDKKIGDVVVLNIEADGPDYTIYEDSSFINGVPVDQPNVIFTDLGTGNYSLNYTIEEGDDDVGPGELTASIVLIKPSLNTNLPYSMISNTDQLTIDAHAPVVIRLEVPDEEIGVGGTVQVTITADDPGYTAAPGTTINGIPLDSPRISFSERTGGLYELSYVVDSGDDDVAPGTLEVAIVLADLAGNENLPYSILQTNSLEVYTELPTAVLTGTPEICEEESAELSVFLEGRGPWSFDLSDGTGTTTYEDIAVGHYKFSVSPVQTTTYSIPLVRDKNGVENTGGGDISVTVYEKTNVEIINLASGYSVEADPVKLEANVSGGTFSGPGVISATGYFDPALADTVNSPHTIVYTYTNENGCTSVTSKLVFVLGAEGDIFIPSNIVCSNGDPFMVNASNIAGVNGSFRLLNSSSQQVSGLTDNGDNSAIIDPALLGSGEYMIEYAYVDEVTLYIREEFEVETVTAPVIINLNEDSYCQNVEPFILQASAADAVFEGQGVIFTNSNYIFDPGQVDPGEITITCTATSENGCTASTQKSIQIIFAPEPRFTISTACIPDAGGMVAFDNLTGGKLQVENWSWDFDDPESGENNQSDRIDPQHLYSAPGERSISLTATTFEGCEATYVMDTAIGNSPVADFTLLSDCFANGSGIKFINRSTSDLPLDSLIWRFKTETGSTLGEIGTDSSTDTVAFPFASVDSYQVELTAITSQGCMDTVSREIVLRPTIRLTPEGYEEQFNTSEAMWSIRSDDGVESWTWDVPDFEGFEQSPGDNAWFTQLPYGVVGYIEKSWIQSPCFDFTQMERPLIKLDIMKSFVPNMNGAVLQYMDVNEEGWKTVGENTAGIKWYNAYNIYNEPGGSSIGWGLDVFNPDTDWVTAIHDLDNLAGNSNVTFRIAIATSGAQGIGNQGFAFDNVGITERSKRAVIEHFTNSSDVSSRSADDVIDAFGKSYSKDVIDLQYHMSYPGTDPMNENNPNPPSTREFFYGIPKVPYAILDGGVQSDYRYDFSGLKTTPDKDHIKLLSLEIPVFDIDLEVDWLEGSLEATTTVTCMADQYVDNIQLYVVVFESSVTAYTGNNGDTEFRNVVLDMLPTPAGKLLGDNWSKGKSDIRINSWSYVPYVEDIEDLAVAAFVQERSTGRILQAAVDYKDPLVGVRSMPVEIESLHVYPNPVKNSFFVNLGTRAEDDGTIKLTDMSGRVVLTEYVPSGYQIYQVDIQHLNHGMYIMHWFESGKIRGLSKIVKAR